MKVEIGPFIYRWTTTRFERWAYDKVYGENAHWQYKDHDKPMARAIEKVGDAWQVVLDATVNQIQDRRKRKIKVHIDPYDTWNMDGTLSPIILPMLKQLKESKQGSPIVDLEDLPPELQLNYTPANETQQFDMFGNDETDDIAWGMHEKRWNYILDSMIFSFEKLNDDDWESEFYSGEIDLQWEPRDDISPGCFESMPGPNDTFKVDHEGLEKMNKRIQFGLRMFGKYYQALWD